MITEPGYVGIVVELPGLSFSQLEQYRQRVLPPTIPQYFCPPKVTKGRGGGELPHHGLYPHRIITTLFRMSWGELLLPNNYFLSQRKKERW